jgi:MFS family permease
LLQQINIRKEMTKSRVAVSLFFFVNGFLHANLMARLPQLQAELAISDSILGTLLLTVAVGSMIGMPIIGGLATRFGSDRMAWLMALVFCVAVPLTTMSSDVWLTGLLFSLLGASMGAMDVCMNGQAVYVERLWDKPIMSSFHAVFSIGMASGAGMGALFSKFQIPLNLHVGAMAIVSGAIILGAARFLVKENAEKTLEKEAKSSFSLSYKAIIPVGLIAFCCMTGEGSLADWSAIYMNKVVGKDPAYGAIAFGTFAAGMTLGRIFGDFTTAKFGRRQLMIYDALLATLGLSIALLHVSAATTLIGFFMVGVGVATVVPIVFSTAGNTEGVHPSVGIAMATSIGYTGFFIGPPAIGFLSDAYGLRIGLMFSLLLFVLMLFLILKFIKK